MVLQRLIYVYEPGQFAVRGSIIDVYSFSNELPFRIDFFGDDIETIRNFEVETQLSTAKLTRVEIVPELTTMSEEKVPFLQFLPGRCRCWHLRISSMCVMRLIISIKKAY